jgi:hypothetical protein
MQYARLAQECAMRVTSEKFDEIRKNPSRFYRGPQALADDKALTEEQKLSLLESWAADEERLLVATEENMGGGESSRLDEVLAVLGRLRNPDSRLPSKH